jgi:hypothetical protein
MVANQPSINPRHYSPLHSELHFPFPLLSISEIDCVMALVEDREHTLICDTHLTVKLHKSGGCCEATGAYLGSNLWGAVVDLPLLFAFRPLTGSTLIRDHII